MPALADREWRLIPEDVRPGPLNMALDEVAAETAAAGGPRTARVFSWEPSTLTLGYHQDAGTVDWEFCEREGIEVTRRPTGGGGIYHDRHGDLSYSVVAPAEDLPGNLMETYELLCEPLFSALERMGVDAAFADAEQPAIYEPACYLLAVDPAHDVVGPDGRKLSGNAQYRQRDSVIQHGSLTYERMVEHHLGVFAADLDPGAFRERVTAVREQAGIDRESAVEAFEGALADWADATVGEWTDDELRRGRELAAEKFGDPAWIRERVDPTI